MPHGHQRGATYAPPRKVVTVKIQGTKETGRLGKEKQRIGIEETGRGARLQPQKANRSEKLKLSLKALCGE